MNPSAASPPALHLLDSDASISEAAEFISKLDLVALDTEFHSERRYRPEIMLMQVCSPEGETWLADPKNCDLGPLIRAVSSRHVVLHAGQEDIAILQREADVAPHDLFDVQIAAGMLGLGYPTRLSKVLEDTMGETMDKHATLSDWSRRPLSPEQVRYAAMDVQILPVLAESLKRQLKEKGRLTWAVAASSEMAATNIRPRGCRHSWTDWDIASQLDEVQQTNLQAIFEWRDARGRDKDQPAHFMLSDGLALDLARRRPASLAALQANRRIPGGLVRRFGDELVRVISRAPALQMKPLHIPTATQRNIADSLTLWAQTRAPVTGIAARLAMPRDLALSISRKGISALIGWRAEAMGEDLERFLSGESSIILGADGPQIR